MLAPASSEEFARGCLVETDVPMVAVVLADARAQARHPDTACLGVGTIGRLCPTTAGRAEVSGSWLREG